MLIVSPHILSFQVGHITIFVRVFGTDVKVSVLSLSRFSSLLPSIAEYAHPLLLCLACRFCNWSPSLNQKFNKAFNKKKNAGKQKGRKLSTTAESCHCRFHQLDLNYR